MTNGTRTIELIHLMNITVPDGLQSQDAGTVFIDGIDSLNSPHYKSAALVAGPDPSLALGIVYFDLDLETFQMQQATQAAWDAWPLTAKVTAACGVEGGLAAFATQDEGIPSVDVYNSPLSSGGPPSSSTDWSHSHTIAFDQTITHESVTGTVQNMLERDGKLYGFIKAKPPQQNAFFFADALRDSTATVVPYAGNAALAFLPLDTEALNMMQRRIAFYGKDKVYTIDDSYSYALCADLNTCEVRSFPLAKQTTRGLLMHVDQDPAYNKAYTGYDPRSNGYIMPYKVNPGGDFTRGMDTIAGGTGVCPSLDQNLGLLYLIAMSPPASVVDIYTDKAVTLTGDALPGLDDFAGWAAGTWVDNPNNVLYVSGVSDSSTDPHTPQCIRVYMASNP